MRYRNIIMAIAAAAALAAASTTGALARGGHGGGMGGGMGGGHMGGGWGGGWSGHAAGIGFASRAAIGPVGPVGFVGARSWAWHGNHFPFRHRFVRNRFFFAGAPYYAYYDDGCYTRVWTPYGWRWTNVCTY